MCLPRRASGPGGGGDGRGRAASFSSFRALPGETSPAVGERHAPQAPRRRAPRRCDLRCGASGSRQRRGAESVESSGNGSRGCRGLAGQRADPAGGCGAATAGRAARRRGERPVAAAGGEPASRRRNKNRARSRGEGGPIGTAPAYSGPPMRGGGGRGGTDSPNATEAPRWRLGPQGITSLSSVAAQLRSGRDVGARRARSEYARAAASRRCTRQPAGTREGRRLRAVRNRRLRRDRRHGGCVARARRERTYGAAAVPGTSPGTPAARGDGACGRGCRTTAATTSGRRPAHPERKGSTQGEGIQDRPRVSP